MDDAYLALGKIGDVLSILAIAQGRESNPQLIVSRQYASVVRDIPGVGLHIYDGDWDDLAGAIRWGKRRFRKLINPQTFGRDFPIKNTRPSFQLEQANRCGINGHWNQVRLSLPRPANAAELCARHLIGTKGFILVADQSESSPFPHAEKLNQLIAESFNVTHTIVKLSEIRLNNFRDFVALYDAADALVTIDTAHLHLSSASKIPVLAFVTDQHSSWRGSAWHPRLLFHCRYSHFEARKQEFVASLKMELENKWGPVINPTETVHPFAFNPSIIEWKGKPVMAYRHHPVSEQWPTTIAIDGQPLQLPDRLKSCSVEDPRLFIFRDKLFLSYVFCPYPVPQSGPSPCAVAYGELVNDGGWKLTQHIQPKIGKNDLTGQEKNFVFYEWNQKLHCIYQCSPEQIIYQLDGDKPMGEFRSKSPQFCLGQIRGGTSPMPYQGKWLRFFHSQAQHQKNEPFRHYYVGALLMDTQPPFAITNVSADPVLAGNEQYFEGAKYWKPNVTICYGAMPIGQNFLLSVGINDSACGTVLIEPSHLNL